MSIVYFVLGMFSYSETINFTTESCEMESLGHLPCLHCFRGNYYFLSSRMIFLIVISRDIAHSYQITS